MNKKMRILIAYDGSNCADAALEDLRRAGLPAEVEAIVISVADVVLWPDWNVKFTESSALENINVRKSHEQALAAVEEARVLAALAGDRLRANFPTWRVEPEAHGDSPAWAIIKKTEEWDPDLVIVGSHGRSRLGRFILGSVSQKVVTEARCSVRVARGPAVRTYAPVRILIGVDGSPGAEAAVHAVAERVWPAGSDVRVIAAMDPMMATSSAWTEGDEQDADQQAWVRKKVEAWAERLRVQKLAVSFALKKGNPKWVLIEEAEQWGADCIFVGAKGLRRYERFLLGSVAAAVVARAHCSVEVVRVGH